MHPVLPKLEPITNVSTKKVDHVRRMKHLRDVFGCGPTKSVKVKLVVGKKLRPSGLRSSHTRSFHGLLGVVAAAHGMPSTLPAPAALSSMDAASGVSGGVTEFPLFQAA
jgi:hypothetical protein